MRRPGAQPGTARAAPTRTEEPTAIPEVVITTEAANVRSGPGLIYPVVASYWKGEELEAIGRNSESTWLKIASVDGTQGWIAASVVELNTSPDILPIVEAPPTPTPRPTSATSPGQVVYPLGDINRDCVVDDADYDIWLAAYGTSEGDSNYNPSADLNGDGIIDGVDYVIWLNQYGVRCS